MLWPFITGEGGEGRGVPAGCSVTLLPSKDRDTPVELTALFLRLGPRPATRFETHGYGRKGVRNVTPQCCHVSQRCFYAYVFVFPLCILFAGGEPFFV